jgi:hypothetical protein
LLVRLAEFSSSLLMLFKDRRSVNSQLLYPGCSVSEPSLDIEG